MNKKELEAEVARLKQENVLLKQENEKQEQTIEILNLLLDEEEKTARDDIAVQKQAMRYGSSQFKRAEDKHQKLYARQIAAAGALGAKRKKDFDTLRPKILAGRADKKPMKTIAAELNISERTAYRIIKD